MNGSETWIASVSVETSCRRPGTGPPMIGHGEIIERRGGAERDRAAHRQRRGWQREAREPQQVERAAPVAGDAARTRVSRRSRPPTSRTAAQPGSATSDERAQRPVEQQERAVGNPAQADECQPDQGGRQPAARRTGAATLRRRRRRRAARSARAAVRRATGLVRTSPSVAPSDRAPTAPGQRGELSR